MTTGDRQTRHPPQEVDEKPSLIHSPSVRLQNSAFKSSNCIFIGDVPILNLKQQVLIDASQSQPTYSQVVQGSNRPTSSSTFQERQSVFELDSLPLKPILKYQGKPAVVFSLSEKNSLVDKLKFVLVGKFSHGMPPLNHIRMFFTALKLQKSCNITMFDKKHVFIECFSKADYIYIWLHLSWVIEGFIMRVLKWSADFNPTNESAIVPVWVRLEGLPLYMFDEMSLLAIANTIGKLIKVDPRNVARTIVHSARICVELDVSKNLLDSLWVSFEDDVTKVVMEGFMVKVRYDEVPLYCDFCSHIGHGFSTCKRREIAGVQATVVVQDRQDLGASNPTQTAARLGSDTGLEVGTNCNNMGAKHTAVLAANKCFKEGVTRDSLGENTCGESTFLDGAIADQVDRNQEMGNQVEQADIFGKGMQQIECMLVRSFVKAPKPGLQLMRQAHGMKHLQTEMEHHEVPANKLNAANFEQTVDGFNSKICKRNMSQQGAHLKEGGCKDNIDDSVLKSRLVASSQLDRKETTKKLGDSVQTGQCSDQVSIEAFEEGEIRENGTDLKLIETARLEVISESKERQQSFATAGDRTYLTMGDAREPVSQVAGQPTKESADDTSAASQVATMLQASDNSKKQENNVVEMESNLLHTSLQQAAQQHGCSRPSMKPATGMNNVNPLTPSHLGSVLVEEGWFVQNEGLVCFIPSHSNPQAVNHAPAGDNIERGDNDAWDITEPGVEQISLHAHEYLNPSKQQVQELTERMNRLRGKEPDRKDVRLPEKDDYAKKEMKTTMAAPKESQAEEERQNSRSSNIFAQNSTQMDTSARTGQLVMQVAGAITPRPLSGAATEFTRKWAVLVEELVEGKKLSDTVLVEKDYKGEETLRQVYDRIKNLNKIRKQHRRNQNWQDIEDVSDEESEEGELDEKAGSQMLNGEAFLSDGIGDIPRPFKIKSAPNSPNGRNSSYDSSTYLLSSRFS